MVHLRRFIIAVFLLLSFDTVFCQEEAPVSPDMVYQSNIRSVRLHMYGDQHSMPVYSLNSGDRVELHFDDMDADVKSYYYSYQLCDYNWQPVNLSPFDYLKGFTQLRLTTYRYSSISLTRYTHYQAILPEDNSLPLRSGNYLLKVFLDGDTSKLAFTRGLMVVDPKASVAAQIVQPFTPDIMRTHQRIRFNVNIKGINSFSPTQQVKAVVMQNDRWDNAVRDLPPSFVRGVDLEFNTEGNFVFPGGKEWRWLDLRSFSLLSDRVVSADRRKTGTDIYVKADADRGSQRYMYYADLNGHYEISTFDNVNPYWENDYATVHFSFIPPNQLPYNGKDLYLIGQLTDYHLNDSTRMVFNPAKGMYEGSLYLKQGYYDYGYKLVDKENPSRSSEMEGNYWETENSYTILIYYKGFSDQCDQLIGISRINSRTDKPGYSF